MTSIYEHCRRAFERPTKKNKNFREYCLAHGFKPEKVKVKGRK